MPDHTLVDVARRDLERARAAAAPFGPSQDGIDRYTQSRRSQDAEARARATRPGRTPYEIENDVDETRTVIDREIFQGAVQLIANAHAGCRVTSCTTCSAIRAELEKVIGSRQLELERRIKLFGDDDHGSAG